MTYNYRSKRMGKRGSIQDAMFIGIFGVVLAIGLVTMYYVTSQITDEVQEAVTFPTEIQESQDSFDAKFPVMLDVMFLIVMLGSYLATFILAFFIDSHPVFFIMTALVFTGTILVIPYLMNAWQDFAAIDGIATTLTNFPITSYIMNHYLQFTIVMWGMVAVGIYAKRVSI